MPGEEICVLGPKIFVHCLETGVRQPQQLIFEADLMENQVNSEQHCDDG